MESLYVLIPVTLVLVGIALGAWLWSVSSGQFEDLDKAARSILFDDDLPQSGKPPAPATTPEPDRAGDP